MQWVDDEYLNHRCPQAFIGRERTLLTGAAHVPDEEVRVRLGLRASGSGVGRGGERESGSVVVSYMFASRGVVSSSSEGVRISCHGLRIGERGWMRWSRRADEYSCQRHPAT